MRHTCSTCGYCKSGVLLSEVSNGREDPCETCEVITVNEFTNWRPIPTTNADRIRAMSDDELRDFFTRILWGEEPSIKLYMLPEDWEKWLKQECNE